jgi:hypothetical protein
MEQLIELLQQIQELAGVAIDALEGAAGGEGGAPAEGGAPPEGGAPAEGGAPPEGPPEDE